MSFAKCPSCGGSRFEVAESRWFDDGDHVLFMECECGAEWMFCEVDGLRWVEGDNDYHEEG